MAFLGKEVDYDGSEMPNLRQVRRDRSQDAELKEQVDTADIRYGYCTEFIILLEKEYTEETVSMAFKAYLESIGDSIVVVSDDGIVKVHVHTNDPGLAIQKALTLRFTDPYED